MNKIIIYKNALSKNFFELRNDYPNFYKNGEEVKYDLTNLNHKIVLYEDRINGWFLDIANSLDITNGDADFISLMISLSYVEGVAQYIYGETSRGKSEEIFKKKMKEIFDFGDVEPEIVDKILKNIYQLARCGLFHDGMTRNNFNISRCFPTPIKYLLECEVVLVNPSLFLKKVKEDFDKYILSLKDKKNEDLRTKFGTTWDTLFERVGQKPDDSHEDKKDTPQG